MPKFSIPLGWAKTEQSVDVEDPRRHDRRVARPGLDPVAPADQVAGEVAELVARVGVEPTVAVGDALGELAEQDGEQHGAHRDDTENGDAHGACTGQHCRHGEHPCADDAADDQPGAEVSPRACDFSWLRGERVSPGGAACGGGGRY